MVEPWDWRKERKPDVLSVGLPAANYSFFAVIPENNISYIASQHEQTHTHIYIYIQVKTLEQPTYYIKLLLSWGVPPGNRIYIYIYVFIYICTHTYIVI